VLGAGLWLVSLLVEPPGRYWVWLAAMIVLLITPVFPVRAYPGQPYDSRHLAAAFVWGYGHLVVYSSIAAIAVGVEFAIEAPPATSIWAGPERTTTEDL
jgi:low temperature requirement protein LtrA